jgi:hypothetical protein
MEHFCSELEPRNPTEGQLWYDPYNKTLKLYSAVTGGYKWVDLYVDNPDSNGPKVELDAISLAKINEMVSSAGGDMLGPLNIPLETIGADGKPLETTSETASNAATRSYVDQMIKTAVGETFPAKLGSASSDAIFNNVGNMIIVQGQTSTADPKRVTKLYYTNGTHYGNAFEIDVLFPLEVSPFKLDEHGLPKYEVSATCQLSSNDPPLNDYLKKLAPAYPVEIINKNVYGFTLKTTAGLLHDNIELSRTISLVCFKYSVIGNKE